MGQAKNRGTREERIAAAQGNRVQVPIDTIRQEFNLPDNAQFLGCVVWLPGTEEYLASFHETANVVQCTYAKTPALALLFAQREDADAAAEAIPHNASSALLFDLGDQYYVAFDS